MSGHVYDRLDELTVGVSRDSEFMSKLVETFPGRVFAVDIGLALDVDTEADRSAAEEVVRTIRR
jgi:hypothetical protein